MKKLLICLAIILSLVSCGVPYDTMIYDEPIVVHIGSPWYRPLPPVYHPMPMHRPIGGPSIGHNPGHKR